MIVIVAKKRVIGGSVRQRNGVARKCLPVPQLRPGHFKGFENSAKISSFERQNVEHPPSGVFAPLRRRGRLRYIRIACLEHFCRVLNLFNRVNA